MFPPGKKENSINWGCPPVSDPVGKTRKAAMSGIGIHCLPPKR